MISDDWLERRTEIHAGLVSAGDYRTARQELIPRESIVLPDRPEEGFIEESLSGFLNPDSYGWSRERPPLDWYAAILTALEKGHSVPDPILRPFLHAANYFGDSDLSIYLTTAALPHTPEKEFRFELLRARARARKNAGEFEAARGDYREIFTLEPGREGPLEAYAILLYAKLCHDYQQRQGWYREFHEIAVSRFDGLLGGSDWPTTRVDRWAQIARESLASAVDEEDPERADAIFSRLSPATPPATDTQVRWRAHVLKSKMNRGLRSPDADPHGLLRALSSFEELFLVCDRFGNGRAKAVRQAQFAHFARRFWDAGPRKWGPLTHRVQELCHPRERLSLSTNARLLAQRYSDHKTAAQAAFEQGMAAKELARSEGGGRERAAEFLGESGEIASRGAQWFPRLYLSSLKALGEIHVSEGSWGRASECYERAYEYGLGLKEDLDADRRELDRLILGRESENWQGVPPPELTVLDGEESTRLRAGLVYDYEYLLEELLATAQQLSSAREERRSKVSVDRWKISLAIRFHTLSDWLVSVDENLPPGDRGKQKLLDVREELNRWRDEEATLLEVPKVDLVKVVEDALNSGLRFGPFLNSITFSPPEDGRPIRTRLDPDVLRETLFNLVRNVEKVAARSGRDGYAIEVGVVEEGSTVFLTLVDDVGELETLKAVVEALNRGLPLEEFSNKKGRTGLELVRDYCEEVAKVKTGFRVDALEAPWKRLWVPIGRSE